MWAPSIGLALVAWALSDRVSSVRAMPGNSNCKDTSLIDLLHDILIFISLRQVPAAIPDVRARYNEFDLPQVHLDDLYVDTGHELHVSLFKPLLPWTRSRAFQKNGTLWPVITASFSPFSSIDWLVFNSTTYDLYGKAPFSPSSYNASVILTPMFINKTDYVAIPANDSTPVTFAAASFVVHVVSEGGASGDLSGWVPYVLIVVSSIAVIGVIGTVATCISQDLCCSCRSSLQTPEEDICEKESETAPGGVAVRNTSKRRRLLEYHWMFPQEGALRSPMSQVTPYEVTATPGIVCRRKTLMVKHRPFGEDHDDHTVQTAPLDAKGIQRANAIIGMPFAVEINLRSRSHNANPEDFQSKYRVQVAPYPPPWMYFCPRRLVIWGTPLEQLAPAMYFKFSVLLVSNSTDLVVGKLKLTISAPKPVETIDTSFGNVFVGTEKGVWHQHINGVDNLNVLSGTVYSIRYQPRVIIGEQTQPSRYYLKCTQTLPPWISVGSNPLEIKGDTTGYKRRDLRDFWVVDRFTERAVAKLRVTLVIAQEWY